MRLLQNKEVGGQLPYQNVPLHRAVKRSVAWEHRTLGDGRCSTRSERFRLCRNRSLLFGGAFFSGLAAAFQLRKKDGQEPQERQVRADPVDELDAFLVSHDTENGGGDACHAEGEAEEQS
ncbi:hypothetical protein DK64_2305 [Brucella neotomae 5K33]|nr:hypothetical protein DK64_2305 [Brucella neotomae 5K33]